jgi:hypothetical protein
MNEAIAVTPVIRGAPHFMERATRIALLIRGTSARSGLMGRSIQANDGTHSRGNKDAKYENEASSPRRVKRDG